QRDPTFVRFELRQSFVDPLLEFPDARLHEDELEASACSVVSDAPLRKHPTDRESKRQKLGRRHEIPEQFGRMGDGAQAAPDVDLEPALQLTVDLSCFSDTPNVVKARESAGCIRAARERDLEFST